MEGRILVVDDERDICDILQFNLENEGYTVDVAHSGEEALEVVSDTHQLVILAPGSRSPQPGEHN